MFIHERGGYWPGYERGGRGEMKRVSPPEDFQTREGTTAVVVVVVAVLDQLLFTPHSSPSSGGGGGYFMTTSLHLLYHHYLFINNSMVWILCIIHPHDIFLELVILLRSIHTNPMLIFTNNIRIYHHYRHIFKVILISNKYNLLYHTSYFSFCFFYFVYLLLFRT
jgi:hypothetical protein